MGSRANYVIVENSNQSLYFSHWGGQRIDVDLFWGAEHALEFVRSLEPAGELLDNVWCEGAAYINVDKRELLLFGGEELRYVPGLRQVWLELLRLSWAGWNVEWAGRGITEVAERLGIPQEEVYVWQPLPIFTEEELLASPREQRTLSETLISVKQNDGSSKDYLGACDALSYLALGPALLTMTARLQPFQMIAEDLWDVYSIYLDEQSKEMSVMAKDNFASIDPRIVQIAKERWPGWTVHPHDLGWGHHWRLTGRDPSAFQFSFEQQVDWLKDSILRDYNFDPARTFDTLLKHFGEGNVEISAPSYIHVPRQEDAALRKEQLIKLLEQWKPGVSQEI